MATPQSELAEVEEQLTIVRQAIRAAMRGSSYSIGDQSVRRQNLPDLRRDEQMLLRQRRALQQQIAGGPVGGASVATFQR